MSSFMKFLLVFFCCFHLNEINGQAVSTEEEFVVVNQIEPSGHKKTKLDFILRELSFEIGDTILLDDLAQEFEDSRDNLINSNIFNKANFERVDLGEKEIRVEIDLEERFRLYPIPLFEIADQNYNVWVRQHNADLNRLVYGMYLSLYNLRGRGEYLITETLFGYRTYLQATYVFPYIDKNKKMGLSVKGLYRRDRQLAVSSFDNILQYSPPDTVDDIPKEPLTNRYGLELRLKRRKGLDNLQYLQLGYHHIDVEDPIIESNPTFFKDGENSQDYFVLSYKFERDFRDIDNYSLDGSLLQFSVTKRGLGIMDDVNTLSLAFNYSKYFDLGKQFYLASNLKGRKDFGKEIPYYNNTRIGFASNFIRGYENNIVDTQQYLFLRTDVKYQFLTMAFNNPFKKKLKSRYPIYAFTRIFLESANVKDDLYFENNELNNGWLLGAGLAIDFVFSENIPLTLEYNVNKEGQHGFYFHFGIGWDYGILFR